MTPSLFRWRAGCLGLSWLLAGLPGVAAAAPLPEPAQEFAFSLARQILTQELPGALGNVVLSPLGVVRLLEAVQLGAGGASRAEMEALLGAVPAGEPAPAPVAPEVAAQYRQATAVWFDAAVLPSTAYRQEVMARLGAEVRTADFARQPQAAVDTVNRWAAKGTLGQVRQLLAETDVHGAQVVLVNALAFRQPWQDRFDPAQTRPGVFHLPDGQAATATYLSSTRTAAHGEVPETGLALLALPFAVGRFELVCLLPKESEQPGEALRTVEKQLTLAALRGWRAGLREEKVVIKLPKLEFSATTPLIPPLQALGLRSIFDPVAANLSGLSEQARIYIGACQQQATFRLDENGAEATAATASIGLRKTMVARPTRFEVDRPALFLIHDLEREEWPFVIRCAHPPAP